MLGSTSLSFTKEKEKKGGQERKKKEFNILFTSNNQVSMRLCAPDKGCQVKNKCTFLFSNACKSKLELSTRQQMIKKYTRDYVVLALLISDTNFL